MALDPRYDENGWLLGAVRPLDRSIAFTLFATDVSAEFEASLLEPVARAIGWKLALSPQKTYPRGTAPLSDAAVCRVEDERGAHDVGVRTFPIDRALALRNEAIAIAATKGGGGMDAMIGRARRVWQVEIVPDARAALAVAAMFSSARLAAIVPPDGGAVFGPKTARELLHTRQGGKQ
jgi:hypothetical protein